MKEVYPVLRRALCRVDAAIDSDRVSHSLLTGLAGMYCLSVCRHFADFHPSNHSNHFLGRFCV